MHSPYNHNGRPSQIDTQTDEHYGNSTKIRSNERIGMIAR